MASTFNHQKNFQAISAYVWLPLQEKSAVDAGIKAGRVLIKDKGGEKDFSKKVKDAVKASLEANTKTSIANRLSMYGSIRRFKRRVNYLTELACSLLQNGDFRLDEADNVAATFQEVLEKNQNVNKPESYARDSPHLMADGTFSTDLPVDSSDKDILITISSDTDSSSCFNEDTTNTDAAKGVENSDIAIIPPSDPTVVESEAVPARDEDDCALQKSSGNNVSLQASSADRAHMRGGGTFMMLLTGKQHEEDVCGDSPSDSKQEDKDTKVNNVWGMIGVERYRHLLDGKQHEENVCCDSPNDSKQEDKDTKVMWGMIDVERYRHLLDGKQHEENDCCDSPNDSKQEDKDTKVNNVWGMIDVERYRHLLNSDLKTVKQSAIENIGGALCRSTGLTLKNDCVTQERNSGSEEDIECRETTVKEEAALAEQELSTREDPPREEITPITIF